MKDTQISAKKSVNFKFGVQPIEVQPITKSQQMRSSIRQIFPFKAFSENLLSLDISQQKPYGYVPLKTLQLTNGFPRPTPVYWCPFASTKIGRVCLCWVVLGSLLQNLNTTGQRMLPSNPRRAGLRQSTRQLQIGMDIEQSLPRSFSKDRMSRNFGTNLANNMSKKSLMKPVGKVFMKVGKSNGRRLYRKESVEQIPTIHDSLNPRETSYYQHSINTLLQRNETSEFSQKDFLAWQSEIDASMRCTLLCWLIEVCTEFGLKNQTLFMCSNLIDRYLKQQPIPKSRFQLLGVSALFIASKYEQIYPPHISKFVAISGGSYTKHDVFEMESQIILRLDFKLISCTALRFLDMRCLQLDLEGSQQDKSRMFMEYLLLLAILEYRMCWYKPSCMALAAMCLTMSLIRNVRVEPQMLGLATPEDFKQCFAQLHDIYVNRTAVQFSCVRVRFSKQAHFDPNMY